MKNSTNSNPRNWMDEYADFIDKVSKVKAYLIKHKKQSAKARCPCTNKDSTEKTLIVRISGPRNHAHARCDVCKRKLME